MTFYGADNPIDGVILDVLLRKHKSIRVRSASPFRCPVRARP